MVSWKTRYGWMALGGLLGLLGVVAVCKLRDSEKARAGGGNLPPRALEIIQASLYPPATPSKTPAANVPSPSTLVTEVTAPIPPSSAGADETPLPANDPLMGKPLPPVGADAKETLPPPISGNPPSLPPPDVTAPPLPPIGAKVESQTAIPAAAPPSAPPMKPEVQSTPIPPPLPTMDSVPPSPTNDLKPTPLSPPISAPPPGEPLPPLQGSVTIDKKHELPAPPSVEEKSGVVPTSAVVSPPSEVAPIEPAVAPPPPVTPVSMPKSSPITEPPLAPAPGPVVMYHVRAGGETMRDIARRTLGKDESWGDIHRLNPTLQPDVVINAGTTVKLPADACVNDDESVQPLPSMQPNAMPHKQKTVLPLTGTYAANLDDKKILLLPRAIRDQFSNCETLLISPGSDQCLWLTNQIHLDRLADRLERSSARELDVRTFKRLYFAQTEKAAVSDDGRVTVPDKLARFAGLHEEIVLIGIDDHFELWDAAKWREYTQKKSAAARAAMADRD